jgi:hypothetical protein
MRPKFIISVSVFFLSMVHLCAQQNAWLNSTLCFSINSSDSAFLSNTTVEIWKATRLNADVMIYESRAEDSYRRFRTKLSLSARSDELNDSVISNINFYSAAEIVTAWNSNADTFCVLSLGPLARAAAQDYAKGADTIAWVDLSLHYYPFYLEPYKMKRMRTLLNNALADLLNATLSGDTLFRSIEFVPDSNEYLPQASYSHLARFLHYGMMERAIETFRTNTLIKPMTKGEIEAYLEWYENVEVQGGDMPGSYMTLVTRTEVPVSIVVCEKWIPQGRDTLMEKGGINYWIPVYQSYHREVIAYGVRYSHGKVLWHKASDVDTYVLNNAFTWTPYEESFRAERFETMHIALEP